MPDKIAAVYALREAAEEHARIETEIGKEPSRSDRDRLLESRTKLEQKTREAIEICEHCGRQHIGEQPHPGGARVIEGHFGRSHSETASGEGWDEPKEPT